MNKIARVAICGTLCASLSLGATGCANIKNDSTRTQTEVTLVGAAAGATAGAVAGKAFGDSTAATLVGTVAGTVIGTIAGFFIGKHIAQKKAEYANQEDWLNACIENAEKVNKDTKEKNQKTCDRIAELDEKCRSMETKYAKQQSRKGELEELRNNITAEIKELNGRIENLNNEIIQHQSIVQEARSSGNANEAQKIDDEIRDLQKQIDEMKEYNKKLANISARVPV